MLMTAMIPLALALAPSHFTAAVLFAAFTSIVFAITQRSGVREQVRYGFYCFALFVGGVFSAGWLMLLLRR
jgi:phosphatidylserine synthase